MKQIEGAGTDNTVRKAVTIKATVDRQDEYEEDS